MHFIKTWNLMNTKVLLPQLGLRFRKILSSICLVLVRSYQVLLSPIFGGACRFHPSCSEYAVQAFRDKSLVEAFKLTAIRLSKCRPGGEYGFDPVPAGSILNLGDRLGSKSG
jgi:putative membrane protein insertion efficiency factor